MCCAAIGGRHLLADNYSTEKRSGNIKLADVDKTIILLGVIAFGGMFCEGIMYDWSNVYFATVVLPPDNLMRIGYIAGMAAMTVMRFVTDRLTMRYGHQRTLQFCGLSIAAGIWLAVLLPNIVAATAGFILIGMGISATIPICYSLAGNHSNLPASIAITVVSSISFLGFLIGPPIIGLLSEVIGLRLALASVSVFGLANIFIPTLLNQQKNNDDEN